MLGNGSTGTRTDNRYWSKRKTSRLYGTLQGKMSEIGKVTAVVHLNVRWMRTRWNYALANLVLLWGKLTQKFSIKLFCFEYKFRKIHSDGSWKEKWTSFLSYCIFFGSYVGAERPWKKSNTRKTHPKEFGREDTNSLSEYSSEKVIIKVNPWPKKSLNQSDFDLARLVYWKCRKPFTWETTLIT